MELAVLDSDFRRSRLVSAWNSLVWSERYSTNGDFELTSNNISKTLELLPLEGPNGQPTVVALRDSNVPMVVETHKIEKDTKGPPKITTTGRSFETVLDRRITVLIADSNSERVPWRISAASPSDAAWAVMKKIIVDGAPTVLDKIREVTIRDEVSEAWPGGVQEYVVEPKELYEWVIETLKIGEHGFRAVLPPSDSNIKTIELGIYKGADRREEVVFNVAQDRFDKAVYLLSNLGHKNTMIVQTKNGLTSSNIGGNYSGLQRRMAFSDMSSEITLAPGAALTSLAENKGIVSLSELLPVNLFSGEISAAQAARYNYDYFLGDRVTLQGEYGLKQDVRVAEFVRTQDLQGERSYPAFEAVAP